MPSKGKDYFVDITYAESEGGSDYLKFLEVMQEEGKCPFCPETLLETHDIISDAGGIATRWLLTSCRWPYKNTEYHFLIVPERHMVELDEMIDRDWIAVSYLVKVLTDDLAVATFGGGLAIRFGENSGVTVRHLHFYFIVPKTNPETGKVFPGQHVIFSIG